MCDFKNVRSHVDMAYETLRTLAHDVLMLYFTCMTEVKDFHVIVRG